MNYCIEYIQQSTNFNFQRSGFNLYEFVFPTWSFAPHISERRKTTANRVSKNIIHLKSSFKWKSLFLTCLALPTMKRTWSKQRKVPLSGLSPLSKVVWKQTLVETDKNDANIFAELFGKKREKGEKTDRKRTRGDK